MLRPMIDDPGLGAYNVLTSNYASTIVENVSLFFSFEFFFLLTFLFFFSLFLIHHISMNFLPSSLLISHAKVTFLQIFQLSRIKKQNYKVIMELH